MKVFSQWGRSACSPSPPPILRPLADARVEGQKLEGFGVQQVIWGVPSQKYMDRLIAELRKVTKVSFDADGTVRYFDCDGISSGIRLFHKKGYSRRARPGEQLWQ